MSRARRGRDAARPMNDLRGSSTKGTPDRERRPTLSESHGGGRRGWRRGGRRVRPCVAVKTVSRGGGLVKWPRRCGPHTSPKREQGLDRIPRARFGLVWASPLFTIPSTPPEAAGRYLFCIDSVQACAGLPPRAPDRRAAASPFFDRRCLFGQWLRASVATRSAAHPASLPFFFHIKRLRPADRGGTRNAPWKGLHPPHKVNVGPSPRACPGKTHRDETHRDTHRRRRHPGPERHHSRRRRPRQPSAASRFTASSRVSAAF